METNSGATTGKRDYLESRLALLGITEDENKIRLHGCHQVAFDIETDYDQTVFGVDANGNITINLWSIDRYPVTYKAESKARYDTGQSDKEKSFFITRLSPDNIKKMQEEAKARGEKDPEIPKYIHPKGQGTVPFFHDNIITKYEKAEQITTLVLTEGYFKAFKANKHGIPVVGLAGITTSTDKTKKLHTDIAKLITTCRVKNVIMLYDGDCLNISMKAVAKGVDLATRPAGFYNSMLKIIDLMRDFDVDVYFSYIKSSEIEGEPKGLDDLLVQLKGKEEEVREDLLHVGGGISKYFDKMRVTRGKDTDRLKKLFNLKSAEHFYQAWDIIIADREFVYYGSTYKCETNKDGTKRLILVESRDLQEYMRVGTDYYRLIDKPILGTDEVEKELVSWKKSTIIDDYGKEALKRIVIYNGFINYPDNITWQKVRNHRYNLYAEVNHSTEPGSFYHTSKFIRHIFGEQYELGLDYLKNLYEHPTQPLPVLCLVSRERKTGKSTFLNFLKLIFRSNAIICGNADIQSEFNEFIATKLIVAVDETSLADNAKTTEKIKMLSTARKLVANGKGKNQIEVDHFAKYILCSNDETRFIYTTKEETRFWVRKVPTLADKEDINILQRMSDELPHFLDFLRNRSFSVENTTRTFFDEKLIRTEAFENLANEQMRPAEKLLRTWITEYFEDFDDEDVLEIDKERLKQWVPGLAPYEKEIDRICRENLGAEKKRDASGKTKSCRFKFYVKELTYEESDTMTTRAKAFVGRPYVFNRKDFL